jgi:hypothetical protein
MRRGDFEWQKVGRGKAGPSNLLLVPRGYGTPAESKEAYWKAGALPDYIFFSRNPALFRTFAATPLTQEGVKDFAEEYGMMGIHTNKEREVWESLAEWVREINEMRLAVGLWDLHRQGSAHVLARLFHRGDTCVQRGVTAGWILGRFEPFPAPSPADAPLWPERPFRFSLTVASPPEEWSSGFLGKAFDVLSHLVNRHIEHTIHPQLMGSGDPQTGRPHLYQCPRTILGGLWLQFAEAIAGGNEQRACKLCGRWFEISTGRNGSRKDRLFCSDACKSKDYRTRRDRARQLKAEGWRVPAIATELDTDVATVKKWTSKRMG